MSLVTVRDPEINIDELVRRQYSISHIVRQHFHIQGFN